MRIEDGRHILDRVVVFAPGCMIGDRGVGSSVGLVKGVASKSVDIIKEFLGNLAGDSIGDSPRDGDTVLIHAPVNEEIAVALKQALILLAHGPADIIRLGGGEACQVADDTDDLLLVDDDAVGNPQDRLQKRPVIADSFGIMAALDIAGDLLHGAGPEEGHPCDDIFEGLRLQLFQELSHAAAFQLEDRVRLSPADHFIDPRIIEGHPLEVDPLARLLLNQAGGLLQDRKGSKSEEVKLQEADILDIILGELDDNGFVISGQRRDFTNRLAGDDDPGRMRRGVPGHALELPGKVNDPPRCLIRLVEFIEIGVHLKGQVDGHLEQGGNHLGDPVRFGVGDIQGTAHIADNGPGRQSTEGNHLTDMIGSVFLGYIIDDLAPAFIAKINIKVRHTDPFLVEKTLEEQVIFQGINICNKKRIGSQ